MTLDPKNILTSFGHNRSTSSLLSEAATFHSAVAGSATDMEPSKSASTVISLPQEHSVPLSDEAPSKPEPTVVYASPKQCTATEMARTDSGYDPGSSTSQPQEDKDKRRSASISSSQRTRRKRHSVSSTTSSTNIHTRPSAKRTSRSTPASSIHRMSSRSSRYGLHSRHTTPHPRTPLLAFDNADGNPVPTYTFFQFPRFPAGTTPPSTAALNPSLPDTSSEQDPIQACPPPPPATIHYFLLPETRRLEYAAIDAASRGVRGLVTRLIPDCILPAEHRRRRFCSGDADSDGGSVRRYRIPLTGEKSCGEGDEHDAGSARARKGFWKRLIGGRS